MKYIWSQTRTMEEMSKGKTMDKTDSIKTNIYVKSKKHNLKNNNKLDIKLCNIPPKK